jgi:hypothetical protein
MSTHNNAAHVLKTVHYANGNGSAAGNQQLGQKAGSSLASKKAS